MQIAETEVSDRMGLYSEDIGFGDLIDNALLESEAVSEMNSYNWLKEGEERVGEYKKRMKSLMTTLLSEIPLPAQEEHIHAALNSLVGDYVAMRLEVKYDLLHSDLFELERRIMVDESRDIWARIPSFASVRFGEKIWEGEASHEDSYSHSKINMSSKAPPIPKKVKEKAKEFYQDYFGSISRALKDEVVGDLMLRRTGEIEPVDFKMYWIPLPSELEITVETIDKDPILVAHNLGRNFLVAQWSVENEQPYEHYLREFSSKSLSNLGYAVRADDD